LVTIGPDAHNEKTGAADRPELFQEVDAAETRESLADDSSAGYRACLDRLAFFNA